MIRWLILGVLIVGVTAAATITVQYLPADVASPATARRAAVEATGPPPLAVISPAPVHDFGLMSEHDEDTTSWTIGNDGEGTLRLRFLEAPCTCTSVRAGPEGRALEPGSDVVVEPGEQVELSLTWETRDKVGPFRTYAQFASNDLEHMSALNLEITGMVAPSVVIMPESFEFTTVSSDGESALSSLLISPSHPELQLLGPPTTSRPDLIAVEARSLTEEELAELMQSSPVGTAVELSTGYELIVTIKPGMPLGNFYDTVIVKTDHPVRPQIEIPVSGKVIGPISHTPSRIYMPGISSRDGGSQGVTLTVRNHEQTNFSVRIPRSLQDILQVSIEPDQGSASASGGPKRYRMTVEVPPGSRADRYRGTIVLETDHPDAAEVEIPIEILIRSS